jgi:hypothetical protein
VKLCLFECYSMYQDEDILIDLEVCDGDYLKVSSDMVMTLTRNPSFCCSGFSVEGTTQLQIYSQTNLA